MSAWQPRHQPAEDWTVPKPPQTREVTITVGGQGGNGQTLPGVYAYAGGGGGGGGGGNWPATVRHADRIAEALAILERIDADCLGNVFEHLLKLQPSEFRAEAWAITRHTQLEVFTLAQRAIQILKGMQ